jgi:hypothetical protein
MGAMGYLAHLASPAGKRLLWAIWRSEGVAYNLDEKRIFLILIRRNPLISPDSEK